MRAGLIGAVLNALFVGSVYWFSGKNFFVGIGLGLINGLIVGTSGGFIYGISFGSFASRIEPEATPNQGIKMSFKNAIFCSIIGGLFGFLATGTLYWLILVVFLFLETWSLASQGLNLTVSSHVVFVGDFKPEHDVVILAMVGIVINAGMLLLSAIGFCIGCISGLLGGGGKPCIQHLILRLILYCNGDIPWNYARFLDYATERIFLQKVGGGYIFIHRMLMEHFAQMKVT